jgi:ubiquinone/menaquinone biosynthesis C-methylase UbiE
MISAQDRSLTRKTYDRLSSWYDYLSGPAEAKARRTALELLDIQEKDVILELGSGTGSALVEILHLVGGQGMGLAIDLSPGMLHMAAEKIRRRGTSARAGLMCGDIVRIPLRSRSLSKIFISFTLELFNDEEMGLILAECKRTLDKQGQLCALSMSKWRSSAMLGLYEGLHARYPHWIDCRPIFLRQILEENGFKTIAARRSALFGLPIETVLAEVGE